MQREMQVATLKAQLALFVYSLRDIGELEPSDHAFLLKMRQRALQHDLPEIVSQVEEFETNTAEATKHASKLLDELLPNSEGDKSVKILPVLLPSVWFEDLSAQIASPDDS